MLLLLLLACTRGQSLKQCLLQFLRLKMMLLMAGQWLQSLLKVLRIRLLQPLQPLLLLLLQVVFKRFDHRVHRARPQHTRGTH
jgi:hypothetical protein